MIILTLFSNYYLYLYFVLYTLFVIYPTKLSIVTRKICTLSVWVRKSMWNPEHKARNRYLPSNLSEMGNFIVIYSKNTCDLICFTSLQLTIEIRKPSSLAY